jgi:hypothetical protein
MRLQLADSMATRPADGHPCLQLPAISWLGAQSHVASDAATHLHHSSPAALRRGR